MRKKITVLTPCFNEEEAIRECYERVRHVFCEDLHGYDYEHLFIDNCSQDSTVKILKEIAASDGNVKIIVNSRNYGMSRSPYHGMLQMNSDAVVPLVADLQTPPELIPVFVRKWEEGYKMVLGIRTGMEEGWLLRLARYFFYAIMARLSDVEQIRHFIGFGLFDKKIIQIMKDLDEPTPYFRGIVSEIGFEKAFVEYHQPERRHGKTRHGFFDLLEYAILGLTSYSKVPLRIMTIIGVVMAAASVAISVLYLGLKLMFWDTFGLGIAPLLIGFFFFVSVQLLFLGLLGEYVGLIFEKVRNRPLVIEKERVNFDSTPLDDQ